MVMLALLVFVPISLALKFLFHANDVVVFVTALVGIVPLADWMRKSTEELAKRAGSGIGGLLNVTFGNMAELVLALFMLAAGEGEVAKAQITGSIIGNSLLGLGLAAFIGGLKKPEQKFGKNRAGLLSGMLILSLFALLIPAMYDYTEQRAYPDRNPIYLDEKMSIGVSVVLLIIYFSGLLYTLVTHREMFGGEHDPREKETAWPLWKSIGLLVGATALVAVQAEMVSGALATTAAQFGISKVFLGITILAVVGNAAEYISAVYFARRDKMGMALTITVGASIQVALMVAPILVLASFLLHHRMNLVFTSPLELVSIAAAAFAVNTISQDGESTWFEGVFLLGVYLILCVAFYFVTPGPPLHPAALP